MKKIASGSLFALALLGLSFGAEARRSTETEINFWLNGNMIGSVTYGCEGGQYFEWTDGVLRTKDESRALASTTQHITGYKMTCPTFTPAAWSCASDVVAPQTWEDAVISCNWNSI